MKYVIEDTTLTSIGDAIRGKKGTSALIPVPDLASEISSIPQGITPSGTKSITDNGTYDVTNYASATVNVPQGITPSGQISITENGTFDVTSFASALVNVSGGGELPDWIVYGEMTPQSNLEEYTVTHNMGKKPILELIYRTDLTDTTAYMMGVGIAFSVDDTTIRSSMAYTPYNGGSIGGFATNYPAVSTVDDNVVTFLARSSVYNFKQGKTYKYILLFNED